MTPTTILMGNLGYLRGINGTMAHHLRFAHRHFFCSTQAQKAAIAQVAGIIAREDPDICCFVEIDKGHGNARSFNQMEALVCEKYRYYDIENKYGHNSRLRKLPATRGKSNGFLAKHNVAYEKVHFTHGTKRLIYKLKLDHVTIFFAHFSLKKAVRTQQLLQMRELIAATPGEVILLGDFNILTGFAELAPLLDDNNLVVLNREDAPTFRFHRFQLALDLCIATRGIAPRIDLRIIPQPYSDHAALLVRLQ